MADNSCSCLGSFVIDTASKIQDLGKKRYRASEPWKDFLLKVEVLRRKHDFWHAEFQKLGTVSDGTLIETLHEAKTVLEKEQAKLLKRAGKADCSGTGGGFGCCLPNLGTAVFPDRVGRSIQSVINAFDNIPGFRRAEEDAAAAIHERMMRRLSPVSTSKDDRYVPLKVSESAIYFALDNPHGSTVILLHGRPGTGKATLAKAVALHYKEATGKAVFEDVVYLECGPHADTTAKQFELLQLLGSDAAVPQELSGADLTIPKRLAGVLKDQSLLIIFDDICEGEFLQRMVDLCGSKVRCLVTSQLRNLCRKRNFKSTDIQIMDIQPEDARRILASHVELPNRQIPQYLEGIANKMIQETKANPLALASIATAIDRKQSDGLEEWQAASKRFSHFLQSEDSADIHGKKYPRGFWSAMRLSLESLTEEEKKLLTLMHMCEGPSVPEEVIHVFYQRTKFDDNSANFSNLLKKLEKRELVKITLKSNNHREQRSWSIHSLHKRFIGEEMTNSRLEGLWGIESESTKEHEIVREFSDAEETMMITLVALYFEKQFAETAASKIGISFDRFNNLRRSAIEPITRLLGQPVNQRWTKSLLASGRQVFLAYIRNGAFDDEGISKLLASSFSILAMLTALKDIALVENTTLLTESTQGIMKCLVGLLGDVDGINSNVREAAGRALFHLSCDNSMQGAFIVAKSQGLLERVVRVLSADPHPEMRVWAAKILGHLGRPSTLGTAHIVMDYPGALAGLVKSLSKEDNPRLQVGAAWAMANLASGAGDTKSKIINFPRALEELVESLSKDQNPNLQVQAAIALANLAGGDDEKKLKIVNSIGALEKLVQSLSKETNLDLQRHAARALGNLSAGSGETKLKIFHCPQALEELVTSLSKDNIHYLQKHAARALANLAAGDGEKKSTIVNTPGAIEELVKALPKASNSDLQEHVARALANLAAGDGEKKLKIVNSPGAVDELVKALSKDDNPHLQEHAAVALANLAGGDAEKKMKVANSPGAIEALVNSLSKDNNAELQRHAARALAKLAAGDGATKQKIASFPGAMQALEVAMTKETGPYLHKYAAKAVAKLAAGDGERKRKSSINLSRRRSTRNSEESKRN